MIESVALIIMLAWFVWAGRHVSRRRASPARVSGAQAWLSWIVVMSFWLGMTVFPVYILALNVWSNTLVAMNIEQDRLVIKLRGVYGARRERVIPRATVADISPQMLGGGLLERARSQRPGFRITLTDGRRLEFNTEYNDRESRQRVLDAAQDLERWIAGEPIPTGRVPSAPANRPVG